MTDKRSPSNTTSMQIQRLMEMQKEIAYPPGWEFERFEEKAFYDQLYRAREPSAWRAVDLVLLAQISQMEMDCRGYRAEILKEGDTIVDGKGTVKLNPLHTALKNTRGQILATYRMLSLAISPEAAKHLNRSGQKVDEEKDQNNLFDDNLLATH